MGIPKRFCMGDGERRKFDCACLFVAMLCCATPLGRSHTQCIAHSLAPCAPCLTTKIRRAMLLQKKQNIPARHPRRSLAYYRHAVLRYAAFLLSRLPCFHYWALCFVVVRRSLGHALNVRSLLHGCHASPTEKIAGSDFSRAKRARRARIRDDTRKNILRSMFLSSDEKKQPSFSPLLFIISAEGGGDEQCSEAGIQLKYASGVAGHNTRRSRVIPFTPL